MKKCMEKMESITGHRGLVMSGRGPGVRVRPEEFTQKARELLDDGTEAGRAAADLAIAKAYGTPWVVSNVPVDMSREAVGRLLFKKCNGWEVSVGQPRMGKVRGTKSWRVLAQGSVIPPEQFTHRGQVVLVAKAPAPSRSGGLVRTPKPRKRKPKNASGEQPQPKEPLWLKGWKEPARGPAWADRSYARLQADQEEWQASGR